MAKRFRIGKVARSPLALIAAGALAWKYRFKIQERLETMGVKTPWMGDTLSESVQSGGAKVSGKIKNALGVGRRVPSTRSRALDSGRSATY